MSLYAKYICLYHLHYLSLASNQFYMCTELGEEMNRDYYIKKAQSYQVPKTIKMENLSFGEQLVGIQFNPANDDKVSQIKTKMAELANLVNDTEGNSYLFNLIKGDALRSILHAQMVSVKLVTLKY